MSMITVTSTAATILGAIKRRCSASFAVVELAGKSDDLVGKIRELLKTLEDGAQVPHDTRGISAALNHRSKEFDAVLKNLKKMNQRTKRTHPADRTEKFIMAQGWAKKMEALHAELVDMRSGVENIVSIWDVAKLITKDEKTVTVDATKKRGLGESKERCNHVEIEITARTVTVDQCLMTMVKLNDANREALNRCGNLSVLSLPDALFKASLFVHETDKKCEIQLLMRAAELLHPDANHVMGLIYEEGLGVERDPDLALFHFRVGSYGGLIASMIELIIHYHLENDSQSLLKYIYMGSTLTMDWWEWIQFVQCAIAYCFESTEFLKPLVGGSLAECAVQRSVCHFFGLGGPKSNQKALDALQTFDFSSSSTGLELVDSYYLRMHGVPYVLNHHEFLCTNSQYKTGFRDYADFLFKAKQYLPFLLFAHENPLYSREKYRRKAFHLANSDCVDAHIFLAHHFANTDQRNERQMKRHLRIAAKAGHSDAQSICRQLFGGRAKASKGLKPVEEKQDGNQRREENRPPAKPSKKRKADSQKKRTSRDSKKCTGTT